MQKDFTGRQRAIDAQFGVRFCRTVSQETVLLLQVLLQELEEQEVCT